jgi:hypothetical protein
MKQKVLLSLVAGILTLVSTSDAEQVGSGHYVPGATASFIDALPDKSVRCHSGWSGGHSRSPKTAFTRLRGRNSQRS